jgi:hypothetical protein
MLKNRIIFFLALFFTVGCNFPLTDLKNIGSVSDQEFSLTLQKSLTLTASITLETSGSTPAYEDCYWNWATKPLPEGSDLLQEAINAKGLSNVTGNAEAYGENCIDPSMNQVARFAVMETDFRFTVEVADLSDTQTLGDLIFQIIAVIQSFPEDAFPGAHPGYVGIRFQSGNKTQNLWFLLDNAESSIADGKQGSELYLILIHRD